MTRLFFFLALFGCNGDNRAATGELVHDCPIMDTGTETGIVVVGAPLDAAVLAWECASVDVDCVSATTGRDDRGWWRAACSGDDERPVLVVRWWVSL